MVFYANHPKVAILISDEIDFNKSFFLKKEQSTKNRFLC